MGVTWSRVCNCVVYTDSPNASQTEMDLLRIFRKFQWQILAGFGPELATPMLVEKAILTDAEAHEICNHTTRERQNLWFMDAATRNEMNFHTYLLSVEKTTHT